MTLVEIRCKAPGCRRLLHEVSEAPDDWSAGFNVATCPRHGVGRRDAGQPGRRVLFVQWRVLAAAIEQARTSGRATEHLV